MSKKLMEAKRLVVRHISHEIRTPLNIAVMGVTVLADRMRQKSKDDPNLEILEDLSVSLETSVEILDELLLYEKLDGDLLVLDKSRFPLCPFLSDTIRPFHLQATEGDISFDISYTPRSQEFLNSHPILEADKSKLGQVVRNLVSNGLKFSKKVGKFVHVEIDFSPDVIISGSNHSCGAVVIRVVDHGPGISKVVN